MNRFYGSISVIAFAILGFFSSFYTHTGAVASLSESLDSTPFPYPSHATATPDPYPVYISPQLWSDSVYVDPAQELRATYQDISIIEDENSHIFYLVDSQNQVVDQFSSCAIRSGLNFNGEWIVFDMLGSDLPCDPLGAHVAQSAEKRSEPDPCEVEGCAIQGINVKTGEYRLFYEGPQLPSVPSVSGDYLVWTNGDNIALLNITSSEMVTITNPVAGTDPQSYVSSGQIQGDWAFWREGGSEGEVLSFFNVTNAETMTIPIMDGYTKFIDMVKVDDKVVLRESKENGTEENDIFLYDLSSRKTIPIAVGAEDGVIRDNISFNGRRIGWREFDPAFADYRIKVYEINMMATHTLYEGSSIIEEGPLVGDNLVVWQMSGGFRQTARWLKYQHYFPLIRLD